jgi:hypothetical protein
MISVTISTEDDHGTPIYRVAGHGLETVGKTPGQALDDFIAGYNGEIDSITATAFVPDSLFTFEQQRRMRELRSRRQTALDQNRDLSPNELAELESLADAELEASARRTPFVGSTR